jgi:hypothetical protein
MRAVHRPQVKKRKVEGSCPNAIDHYIIRQIGIISVIRKEHLEGSLTTSTYNDFIIIS